VKRELTDCGNPPRVYRLKSGFSKEFVAPRTPAPRCAGIPDLHWFLYAHWQYERVKAENNALK